MLLARIIGINIIRINTVSDYPGALSFPDFWHVGSGALTEPTALATSVHEKLAFVRVSARLCDTSGELKQPQRLQLHRQGACCLKTNPALESFLDGWMSLLFDFNAPLDVGQL